MSAIKELTLYSYFYSSASWRIRSVLALKKIPFKYETVQLLEGQQHSDDFVKLSPMHQIPALKVEFNDGQTHVLAQSLAIIQFIEHHYPEPSIYPKCALKRAKSQAIAETISSGIQPLQNYETLVKYTEPLEKPALTPEERKKVATYWIKGKLEKLEKLVAQTAGQFCVGDELTVADICLVPQMFNARRFEMDTTLYPTLKAIDDRLQEMEIFKVSHPMACPDAPKQTS